MKAARIVASRKDPSVRIRFTTVLLREIRAAARRSGRSQNSEILYRLAGTFDAPVASVESQRS